jgi:hypothetical protein
VPAAFIVLARDRARGCRGDGDPLALLGKDADKNRTPEMEHREVEARLL